MNETAIERVDAASLARARQLLEGGDLVAVPTETVYGLAADATNGLAVAKIFAAKGRPQFNPLICHVADLAMAKRLGDFDPLSLKLALHFWPGPLTLVVPQAGSSPVHALCSGGLQTIALRQPNGAMADLCAALGGPLAAPSANASGKISPTTAQAVADSLGNQVALILDAGPAPVGVESTIVRCVDNRAILLRPGGIAREAIEKVLGFALEDAMPGGKIAAPGMMASHYAPDMPVLLDARHVARSQALITFGDVVIDGSDACIFAENLSPSGDLAEAASNLFAALSRANAAKPSAIAVAPIPTNGLGEAINDRLKRASAPREIAGMRHG